MATMAASAENSRQGINSEIPPCIGLDTRLSLSARPGYGYVYDETPAGLVVYVRNDPINLIDPDGRDPASPWDQYRDGEQWVTFVDWSYYWGRTNGVNPDEFDPYPSSGGNVQQTAAMRRAQFDAAIREANSYFRISPSTLAAFKSSPCASRLTAGEMGKLETALGSSMFLNLADPRISEMPLGEFALATGIMVSGFRTLGEWALTQVADPEMGTIRVNDRATSYILVTASVQDLNTYLQERGAFHEGLHQGLDLDDVNLAIHLGLGLATDFKGLKPEKARDLASGRIDRWLDGCFHD